MVETGFLVLLFGSGDTDGALKHLRVGLLPYPKPDPFICMDSQTTIYHHEN